MRLSVNVNRTMPEILPDIGTVGAMEDYAPDPVPSESRYLSEILEDPV